MARVYTFAVNRADAAALYEAEREARDAETGIWARDWYRVLSPADVAGQIGAFQIVEAVPVSVAVVRERVI